MTATALLSELQNQGVILEPRGDKLAFGPRDRVSAELREKIVAHKEALLRALQPDSTLAEAYKRYWQKGESEPMEAFTAAYAEIVRLESRAQPLTAWRTLREAATAWHAESGVCPFCREPGELHLPAASPQLELRPLVILGWPAGG